MPQTPHLSLVLACYNEAEHLESSFAEIVATLDALGRPYEVICVDDDSRDDTRAILAGLPRRHPHVPLRVILHARNAGRGQSVTDGFRAARGEYAGFLDVDLEVHPRYIPSLLRELERGADVASVRRIYAFQVRSLDRYFMSRGYAALVRRLLGCRVQDTETGYKFFRRERLLPVLDEIDDRRWFWDTEFMVRAERRGLRLVEIPGAYIRRRDKTSTVRGVRDSLTSLRRLVAFRRRLGRVPDGRHGGPAATSGDRYWRERAESFSSLYGARRRLSPRVFVTRFLEARGSLLELLADAPEQARVLDLGCGSGVHLAQLAPRCRRLVGIDYSERMLRLAQDAAQGRAGLVLSDAHALPLRDASFDLVVSLGLLDYVRAPAEVLRECRRVLAPGGGLVVSAPKTPSAFAWLRSRLGNRIKQAMFDLPPIVNVFDRAGLERLLREAGFVPTAVGSVWTTMWMARATRTEGDARGEDPA
jgi:hypothetical protein